MKSGELEYSLDALSLGLASSGVIRDLHSIEDSNGELTGERKFLERFGDSLARLARGDSYGPYFGSWSQVDILHEVFEATEMDLEHVSGIVDDILDLSVNSEDRLDMVNPVIGFFRDLTKKCVLYHHRPKDAYSVPPEVRALARAG